MDSTRTEHEVATISRRRVSVAALVNLVGRIVSIVLGIAVAALMTRVLSVEDFGKLSVALGVVGLAGQLADSGLTQIAVREMASAPRERGQILTNLIAIRFCAGVAVGLAAAAVLLVLMPDTMAATMMVLYLALSLPVGAATAVGAGAQSRLRPDLLAYVSIGQSIAWLGLVVLLAHNDASLAWYGAAFLVAAVLQAVIAWWSTRGVARPTGRIDTSILRTLVRGALPIGLAGMCVTAYYKFDGIILYQVEGAASAAYYAAAFRIIDALQVIPGSVMVVIGPYIVLAPSARNGGQRQRAIQSSLTLLGVAVLPIVVGGAVVSKRLVVSLYGADYAAAAPILSVLLVSFAFICAGWVAGTVLVMNKRVWFYAAVTGGAAVINLPATYFAIKSHGALGAAFVSLFTQVPVATIMLAGAIRWCGLRLPWLRWGQAVCASAAMGGIVWFVPMPSLATTVVLGAVAFALIAFATKALTPDDIRTVVSRREVIA